MLMARRGLLAHATGFPRCMGLERHIQAFLSEVSLCSGYVHQTGDGLRSFRNRDVM